MNAPLSPAAHSTAKLFGMVVISMLIFLAACVLPEGSLSRYGVSDKTTVPVFVPKELREISGIAMTRDGRLFAQGDEQAAVYQLDLKTGEVLKRIYLIETSLLGKHIIKGDFEDIAVAGKRLFLITSSGVLYQFADSSVGTAFADGITVAYKLYETHLGEGFDIEGLCYDDSTDALLIACKEFPRGNAAVQYPPMLWKSKTKKLFKPVFSFSLKTMTLTAAPRFLLPHETLRESSKDDDFKPSGIARHPLTGNFFVLASRGHSLTEISPDGRVLSQAKLPHAVHPQPEGITFDSGGTLYISNEASSSGKGESERRGTIFCYPMQHSK
ncbi:MAG: SdiA-regulated domain-containing protein [Rhizobacter sp.]|nr:SdiA-regulated domain-containing protein [Chlorobiales bacterium]